MADVTRPCLYFEKPGKHNTDQVVRAVMDRLAEGDLKTVVVASTTGYTARQFVRALQGRDDVALVSIAEGALMKEWGAEYPSFPPEVKAELEAQGVVVADKIPYLFHNSPLEYSRWKAPTPEEIIRDTLYAFGQGLKVAVEVLLVAVAAGLLEPFQEVVGVGGTSRGADTAIVARATYPNHLLSQDEAKRFTIREILCKPR